MKKRIPNIWYPFQVWLTAIFIVGPALFLIYTIIISQGESGYNFPLITVFITYVVVFSFLPVLSFYFLGFLPTI